MARESSITLDTPVVSLHRFGISRLGETSAHKLALALASNCNKADAREVTVEDLLTYIPMRYEDRSNLTRISELKPGVEASLDLVVNLAGAYQVGKSRGKWQPQLFIFEVSAHDAERSARPVAIWWWVSGRNAKKIIEYHQKRFTRGTRLIAFGKWEWDSRKGTYALRLNKPDELEILPAADQSHSKSEEEDEPTDPSLAAIHVGRRVPVYRKLGDFKTKWLREIVHSVLGLLSADIIEETLPGELRNRRNLINRADAVRWIHFPTDDRPLAEYDRARSPAHLRMIFEEFFFTSFAIGMRRGERVREKKGAVIEINDRIREHIASVIPFALTKAQRRVINEIFADMTSDAPMNRLLQGDVGSGKTIVALQAMMAAMENGYQTVLMVPTEILAEQHARNVKRLLAKSPFRIELLIGSLRAAEKRELQSALAAGEIHACIGTHALIQESVKFQNLGLVVIDEQHRFGVMQRAELRARGLNPDVLVMTATPIPRSLAMTVYGDLDVSVIDEMPPGRTPIKTVVVGEDKREGVYKGVAREVNAGRQVYVVYPLVEESEKIDLKAATEMYEHLRDDVFPQFKVGLLHGRMKSIEKEDVMRRFVGGEIQILVSTTVIEVGVDVSNASVMVVEHAERFGLSQLHQLRGRVGRGSEKSYCVLLAQDKQTSVARERLGIMEETNDGFRIAEKDLELRGPGEVLGTRQAGHDLTFLIGNLVRDLKILEEARREADYYLTTKRASRETALLIDIARNLGRFGLAAVG